MEYIIAEVKAIVETPVVRERWPEAIRRFEYLICRGTLFFPCHSETNDLEVKTLVLEGFNGSKENRLGLFPVMACDLRGNTIASRVISDNAIGAYATEIHTIFLNASYRETDRFMGCVLLHEIGHAMYAEAEGKMFKSIDAGDVFPRLQEELNMWSFDCNLTMLLGGESLKQSIEESVRNIVQRYFAGGSFSTITMESGLPLEAAYGPIKDMLLMRARDIIYTAHCHMIALQECLGPQAIYWQLQLINWVNGECYVKQKEYYDSQK